MVRTVLLVLASAALLLARPALADDLHAPDGIEVQPLFAGGSASDDDLAEAVGAVSFSMDKCPASEGVDDGRVVRVQLAKPAFESAPVVDAILAKAAQFAWTTCPEPFLLLGSDRPTGQFHYDISEVDAYLPDGQRAFEAVLGMYGMGDGALAPGRTYPWRNYNNFAAAALTQAAANAQQQANAEAQAAYDTQVKARSDAAISDARKAGAQLWTAVKLLFWLGVALVLFLKRETFVRWWYALTPHPAAAMVDSAIYAGGALDGSSYAAILAPVPGSRIEKEVRARQASELTERWRRHEATLRSEERERMEALRERIEEENAFAKAQDELLAAGIDHERAAARVDTLRTFGGKP